METIEAFLRFFNSYPVWARAVILGSLALAILTILLAPRATVTTSTTSAPRGVDTPSVVIRIEIDGKPLPILKADIDLGAQLRQGPSPSPSSVRPTRDEVRELARSVGLLEATKTNPHLRFLEGDMSYWYEQELTLDELRLQFISRRMVLEAAEREHLVIDDQGKLSWAAQRVMADILRTQRR